MKLTEYTAMDLYTVKNAVKIKILYSKSSRSVSRDFRPLFFSWFESIWATDKEATGFSNYFSISPRYLITNFPRGVQQTQEWNKFS